jgi:hypothetical protein
LPDLGNHAIQPKSYFHSISIGITQTPE